MKFFPLLLSFAAALIIIVAFYYSFRPMEVSNKINFLLEYTKKRFGLRLSISTYFPFIFMSILFLPIF